MPHPLFFGSDLGPRDVVERSSEVFEGLPQVFLGLAGVAQASGTAAEHLVGRLDQRPPEFFDHLQRPLPGAGVITCLRERPLPLWRGNRHVQDFEEVLRPVPANGAGDFEDFVFDVYLVLEPVAVPGLGAFAGGRCCMGIGQSLLLCELVYRH